MPFLADSDSSMITDGMDIVEASIITGGLDIVEASMITSGVENGLCTNI
jgi:hypothetical protein